MDEKINSTVCNLCGGQRHSLVYKKELSRLKTRENGRAGYTISESELEKPRELVRCMTCGLVFASLGDSERQKIRADYQCMEDPDYIKEEKGRRAQARAILKHLHSKKGGRLLDIGSGPGFFLDEAKRRGWEVAGLDPSAWARDYAEKKFGIKISGGDLTDAGFADRSFDVVVMNDVLEHLEDPKGVLTQIRRILKPDGVIYISTPDIDSFLSRLLNARWWGINRYHLFYFSKKTLKRLLRETGYKITNRLPYPRIFSLGYWARRLAPYPGIISWPFRFAARIGNWRDLLLKVDLHDQLGRVARKVQRLDSVVADEPKEMSVSSGRGKVIVVLPAYNAAKTLERTVADIPKEAVDEIILVDDASRDRTVAIAESLGLTVVRHPKNRGYGANQKTCYEAALAHGAEIIVMCHPDYQYDPKIIPQLVGPIARGEADAVFGSRMMKGGALEGGMPLWKHNANILLTAFENVMLGTYLSEYHSGFRAYSARLLRRVRFKENSDGFIFDTEIIVQTLANYFKIEEVPIRTRYFEEASSIRLGPSIVYGLGILWTMFRYFLHVHGLWPNKKLTPSGR